MAFGKWFGRLVFSDPQLCVPRSGAYTVVAGDATANLVDIVTGFTTVTQYQLTIIRSGAIVQTAITTSKQTGGVIRIADGTYVLTADDIIYWMATGTY